MVVPKLIKTLFKNLKKNTFIVFVGLPASGKTYLSNYLSKKYKIKLLDDPKLLVNIMNFMDSHDSGIIADPNLCINDLRKYFKAEVYKRYKSSKKLKFIYFEHNLNQCLINDQKRPKKNQAQNDIFYFGSLYRVPSKSLTIKVFGSK